MVSFVLFQSILSTAGNTVSFFDSTNCLSLFIYHLIYVYLCVCVCVYSGFHFLVFSEMDWESDKASPFEQRPITMLKGNDYIILYPFCSTYQQPLTQSITWSYYWYSQTWALVAVHTWFETSWLVVRALICLTIPCHHVHHLDGPGHLLTWFL